MNMARKDLRARVRYNPGLPGVLPDMGEHAGDEESFVLETWDDDYKCWCVNTIATLRQCKEFPDEKEREFINYSFMMDIFRLQSLGYKVTLCKAGEE